MVRTSVNAAMAAVAMPATRTTDDAEAPEEEDIAAVK
jgi:hypothetical protein